MMDRVVFLHEFLKHPHQVASIIPSSRFLERRMTALARVQGSQTIVELGGGTGGTTRAILDAMPQGATLLCVEINRQFSTHLKRIGDPRLIVHEGNAQELQEALTLHGLPAPDAVVSGIPFSTMSRSMGLRILEAISASLAPQGRFVAYQVSGQVGDLARPLLGPARVEVELFNIPPLRLYMWTKQTA
jgi:phosphatidylethanolamine/phosphatidyl-N-methylethanolamine N-methyltransferase